MKLHIPDDIRPVFDTTLPLRWGDQDAYGHINNVTYLRYFEEARVRWFYSLGRGLQEGGQGPVVANLFCNYRQQLTYPGDLRIRLFVSQPGRSSLDIWMKMARADAPEVVIADGGCTSVWIDMAQGTSVALPQWLRDVVSGAA